MNYKKELILSYFYSRGWKLQREGNLFLYLKPAENSNFDDDFLLEIPKDDKFSGFETYINRLIDDFSELFPKEVNKDELAILFNRDNAIIKYRIFDNDNANGSIDFGKYINSLDTFQKVLDATVNFSLNKKPMFGEKRAEEKIYQNRCRVLQTEKGSFVTKIEIPNNDIYSTIDEIESQKVNSKLFDVLDFVKKEILSNKKIEITENYISDNQEFLNYELLKSIKDIYKKSNINNIAYTLNTNTHSREIVTEKALMYMKNYESYLKNFKDILFEVVPFEVIGYVKQLSSNNPLHSTNNEIILDAKKFGVKETIKFHIRSEEYLEAIEAHKNQYPIKIIGKAKQLKTQITITEVDYFEIITNQSH